MPRMTPKAFRYAVTGVLAAGMLAGCAGSSHLARAGDHAVRSAGKQGRAVAAAEQTVAQSPNDASARLALGQAYLDAGRFHSAATTFSDAVQLGDDAGSTQLRLALAHIGAGDTRAAVAVLNGARDSISPADRGLALALAGETGRGVAILIDALRNGENSPKLRQNLAFAYALDGRWREARIAMSQDVPADRIDDRISEWAEMSRPEDVQKRVASLLSVPVGIADAGQPEALALGSSAHDEQLAKAQPAAPVAQTAAVGELPAVDEAPAPAVAAPALAVAEPAPVPASQNFAAAFAAPQPQAQYISKPTVQEAPASPARVAAFVNASASQPVAARSILARPAAKVAAAPKHAAVRSAAWPVPAAAAAAGRGTHVVQLGSFSSEANAHRAIGIFTSHNPELRGYRMTITPAVVNGRNFWRVAAAGGLNGGSASHLCSSLKSRGNACFAYALNRAPAGAIQQPALAMAGGGGMKARRR